MGSQALDQLRDPSGQACEIASLAHDIAVGYVLAQDGVARVPTRCRLRIEPDHAATTPRQILERPRLWIPVVAARIPQHDKNGVAPSRSHGGVSRVGRLIEGPPVVAGSG